MKMKAASVTAVGQVAIQEIERPSIGDDEVLIEAKTVGICGSDLHLFRGTHAFRQPPAILGHEIAGRIVAVGRKVRHCQVDDRVTVEPQIGCGKCEHCRKKQVNLCPHKIVPGTALWNGAFVEYFNAPEKTVHALADSVSYAEGALIEPLAVAVRALRRNRCRTKDCLVILGSGTIGLLALIFAKCLGYSRVICTDTAPFNLDMARRHGATLALDPRTVDLPAIVRQQTHGRGADLALVTAGADNILDQASACVRKHGEIGLVAMITEKIPFSSYALVCNEQTLFGAMTYSSADFKEAVDRVNGGLQLGDLVTQVLNLSQTQHGLEILSRKKENVVKVMIEF